MEKRPIDENYSRNQCALMLRMDGDEIYIPLDFGRSSEEVREIYPYLLDLFQKRMPNPAIQFARDAKNGKFDKMSDEEYHKRLALTKKASMLFYDRADENMLALAVRFAVDMKLRGIEELYWLFESITPPDKVKPAEIADSEEAARVLEENGMTHPTEFEFDPGDERDIPLGVAGDLGVNLYGSGAPEDFLNAELDGMESALPMTDKFEQVVEGSDKADPEKHKSGYEKGKKLSEGQVKGGLLGLYDGEESSVFDDLDKQDGLRDPSYDDDYEDFQSSGPDKEPFDDDVPEAPGEETDDGENDDDDDTVPFGSVTEEDDDDDFVDENYVYAPPDEEEGDDESDDE